MEGAPSYGTEVVNRQSEIPCYVSDLRGSDAAAVLRVTIVGPSFD